MEINTMKSRENFINDLGLSDSLMDANSVSTTHEGNNDEVMRSAVAQVEVKRKKNGLPHGVRKEELMNAQGKEKRITPKMQAFVSNIAQGLSPKDAYRKAYDCSNSAESTIISGANTLLKDSRITQLLESVWETVKENIVNDAVATKRHVMSELFKDAQNEEAQLSNRLKSLELMGRAVGMFTDKVETKVEEISTDQLKKELESSLALLDGKSGISKPH
jgi:hypothetical protein